MSTELTPELTPEFAVTVRGYDRAQVDEYIDWLREWLSNATARMEAAETQAAQLRDHARRLQLRVDDLEAETSDHPPRTVAALGERLTRILQLAEEGAAAVRADAEAEAEQLLRRARSEADALSERLAERQAELDGRLSDATERAQQAVREAEARAANAMRDAEARAANATTRLKEQAEAHAAAREAEAEQRARQLVDGATEERARVLGQLAAEKASLDAHIGSLVAQRNEVLAGLSKLHESLKSTIVEVPQATAAAAPPETATREEPAPAEPAGAERDDDRTVLFDREAAEPDEAAAPVPRPTVFQRAGSQPAGSHRAGH